MTVLGFKIDKVWIAVSVEDGDEGACAMFLPGMGWLPLIAADPVRLVWLEEQAKNFAIANKITVEIVEMSTRASHKVFKGQLDG